MRARDYPKPGTPLTATQTRIGFLLWCGLTKRQIAVRMDMTEHAIGGQVQCLYRRLDVPGRVELTALYDRQETRDAPA